MFTAIISVIIGGFSDIFWKKSLTHGVRGKVHDLLSYPVGLLIVIYFFYVGLDLGKIDYILVGLTILIMIIAIFNTGIYQKIYREEKISLIIPYRNVNKILTIILSFFIFADVSITSLMITILAIIVVIVFSLDFKNLKLPKTVALLLIAETIGALLTFGTGYLVLKYGQEIYLSIFVISGIIFLTILSLLLGQFKDLKNKPKSFWVSRYIGGSGWIAWFLSLVVIAEMGLSVSILLSFLGIGITLFLSFLILKDKPAKKDLILTVLVTALVGLGFYFK